MPVRGFQREAPPRRDLEIAGEHGELARKNAERVHVARVCLRSVRPSRDAERAERAVPLAVIARFGMTRLPSRECSSERCLRDRLRPGSDGLRSPPCEGNSDRTA